MIQTTLNTIIDSNEGFQELVDNTQEYFEQPDWPLFMNAEYTNQLDYKAVLGTYETSPLAGVMDYSNPDKPIFVRGGLSTISGELESLGMKYQMSAREYRKYLDLSALAGVAGSGITTDMLENIVIPDVKRCAVGPQKTLSYWIDEGMSTGQISLDKNINPKGKVWKKAVVLPIKTQKCTAKFSEPTSAPLTQLQTIMKQFKADKGVKPGYCFISQKTMDDIQASNEFKEKFKMRFAITGGTMTDVDSTLLSWDQVNAVLLGLGLPKFILRDNVYPVEGVDGKRTYVQPFADNRILFAMSPDMGTVMYSFSHSQLVKDPAKTAATANFGGVPVYIQKYNENNAEVTECDLVAFPVFKAVNEMLILKTDQV